MLTYSVLFTLHRRAAGSGVSHLNCRVSWNSSLSAVAFSLGFVVDPAKWSQEGQCCLPRSFHGPARVPAHAINLDITRFREAAREVFMLFDERKVMPSTDDVRREMRRVLKGTSAQSEPFTVLYDAFLAGRSAESAWTDATMQKYRSLRDHLQEWRPRLTVGDLNGEGLASFTAHLRDVAGLQNSTVAKRIDYLRVFLAWAERRGYAVPHDYANFRPVLRTAKRRPVFLTWEELMKLWDFEGTERENQARDIFLFQCFTSLRYSDVSALRWSEVTETSIRVVLRKTVDVVEIELNRWSQELLSRHVDDGLPDDRVFPFISNAYMNKALHDICRKAGFNDEVVVTSYYGSERRDVVKRKWEVIGTHTGRRTFICHALSMGIAPQLVMQWTGHSDYKAMKPYIGITDSSKASAMERFDRLGRDTED